MHLFFFYLGRCLPCKWDGQHSIQQCFVFSHTYFHLMFQMALSRCTVLKWFSDCCDLALETAAVPATAAVHKSHVTALVFSLEHFFQPEESSFTFKIFRSTLFIYLNIYIYLLLFQGSVIYPVFTIEHDICLTWPHHHSCKRTDGIFVAYLFGCVYKHDPVVCLTKQDRWKHYWGSEFEMVLAWCLSTMYNTLVLARQHGVMLTQVTYTWGGKHNRQM